MRTRALPFNWCRSNVVRTVRDGHQVLHEISARPTGSAMEQDVPSLLDSFMGAKHYGRVLRGASGRCPGQLTVIQYNSLAGATQNMSRKEAVRWMHKLDNGYIVAGWHFDQLVRAHSTAVWGGESYNMNRPAGTTLFDEVGTGFIAVTGSHEVRHTMQQQGQAGYPAKKWWGRMTKDSDDSFRDSQEQDADRHACANTTGTYSDTYCGRGE